MVNCIQFINILIESMRKDILELQREIQNKDGESTGTTIKAVLVFFLMQSKKYGWDNFDHIIICSGLSKEEACSMEIELIEKYQTTNKDYGYNLTSGGDCPILSSEAREKMSQAMKGNTNGLGHPCSEEKKEKFESLKLAGVSQKNIKRNSLKRLNIVTLLAQKIRRKSSLKTIPIKEKSIVLKQIRSMNRFTNVQDN